MSRPLRLRRCTTCNTERPSSLVRPASGKQGPPDVCFVCLPTGRLTAEYALKVEAAQREREKLILANREEKKTRPKGRIFDGFSRGQLTEKIGGLQESIKKEEELRAFFTSTRLPRCACCHTAEAVQPDSNGTPWCPVCAHYVFACGHCPAHASQVFFPQLIDNPEPPPHPSLLPPVDYAFSGVDEIEEA